MLFHSGLCSKKNTLKWIMTFDRLAKEIMNPRVQAVEANTDYTLTLTFINGEVKLFDVKPYLKIGIFQELQDKGLFYSVKAFLGSVQWKNG